MAKPSVKLLVIALVVSATLVVIAGTLLIRGMVAGDAMRRTIEAQLSSALGQPVTVGQVSAGLWPRVTLSLVDVRVGEPARVRMSRLDVGTSLRGLISRRIEHATVTLQQAEVELPLPLFAFQQPSSTEPSAPVRLVSIDAIVLRDVTVSSGGRALHGDVDLALDGDGLVIRQLALSADGTDVQITGRLSDVAGLRGELAITAGRLDALQLLDFAGAFFAGANPTAVSASSSDTTPDASRMALSVSVDADQARFGTLALDALHGRASVTQGAIVFDPMGFEVFGGRYEGRLTTTLGEAPRFALRASLDGIDLSAFGAFAGIGDAITGHLKGTLDVSGRGVSADEVARSLEGQARLEASDGRVRNLGLLRSLVLATSMRADAPPRLRDATADEPFSRLAATFRFDGGTARTSDLEFESPDVRCTAAGTIGLLGERPVDVSGRLQLSETLSRQAGRDLLRYTAEGGRVTVPVSVTGPVGDLHAGIDLGGVARRAIRNTVQEEGAKAITRGLGQILSK